MLTLRDWEDWFTTPCTQQFMTDLMVTRQEIMDAWAKGAYTDSDNAHTATQLNAKALGEIGMLDQAIGTILDCQPSENLQPE